MRFSKSDTIYKIMIGRSAVQTKKKSSSISYYCKRTFNRTAGPELITEEWMCMNESEVCVMYISYLILYLSIYLNYLSIYKNQNGTEPMKKKGWVSDDWYQWHHWIKFLTKDTTSHKKNLLYFCHCPHLSVSVFFPFPAAEKATKNEDESPGEEKLRWSPWRWPIKTSPP